MPRDEKELEVTLGADDGQRMGLTERFEALEEFHKENARTFFEGLVSQSGIDVEGNRRTVARYNKEKSTRDILAGMLKKKRTARGLMIFMIVFAALVLGGGAYFVYAAVTDYFGVVWAILLCAIGAALLVYSSVYLAVVVNPQIRRISGEYDKRTESMIELERQALSEVEPLCEAFTDDDVLTLMEKTLPDLTFEKFFSMETYDSLRYFFDFSHVSGCDTQTCETLSGRYDGNPFLFLTEQSTSMGEKTYYGHLTIEWEETERNSDGTWETQCYSQVLTASLVEQCPKYEKSNTLFFGSQAYPELDFIRHPQNRKSDGIDSKKRSFREKRGRRSRKNKKMVQAASVTDSSSALAATPMSAPYKRFGQMAVSRSDSDCDGKFDDDFEDDIVDDFEDDIVDDFEDDIVDDFEDDFVDDFNGEYDDDFDALFCAEDVSNREQLSEMIAPARKDLTDLLTSPGGFSDDFRLQKSGRCVRIVSDHMRGVDIRPSAKRYRDMSFDKIKENFIEENKRYFKNLYYCFAPIFSIPALTEPYDASKEQPFDDESNFTSYTHEVMSHRMLEGDARVYIAPEGLITKAIIKTEFLEKNDVGDVVRISVSGYTGEDRMDFVKRYGHDGNWHDVPVVWTEYIPVSRDSTIFVCLKDAVSPYAEEKGKTFYHGLRAFVLLG